MPEKDPKKLHYVILEELPFCRLDLGYACHTIVFHDEIWKYKLTYEELIKRLEEAKNVQCE